jgi:hypothetical protein
VKRLACDQEDDAVTTRIRHQSDVLQQDIRKAVKIVAVE